MGYYAVTLLILLALSAMFSGTEIAVFSLSDVKLRVMAEKGDPRAALLLKYKEDPNRLLTIILLGNNVVNIASSSISTMLAMRMFGERGVAYAIGIMTYLVLFFGEITPKTLATKYNRSVALLMARPIRALDVLLGPFVSHFQWLNRTLMKIFRIDLKRKLTLSEDEVAAMVEIGHKSGSVHAFEMEIILRALDFEKMDVAQIMVPRPDMTCLDAETTLRDVEREVTRRRHTRYPVYRRKPENIVGVVSIAKLFETAMQPGGDRMKLGEIMEKAHFVPENQKLLELMEDLERSGAHMAIVVDEFGVVQGLVANGDLASAALGQIWRSPDIKKEGIHRVNDSLWIVGGGAKIQSIEAHFDFEIPEKRGYETFGGFLLEKADHVPSAGDVIDIPPYRITIVQVEKNRILSAKVEQLEEAGKSL